MKPVHGGDLAAAAESYGVDTNALIDFSANIAAYGPPPGVSAVLASAAREPRGLAPYPSPAYTELRAAIARKVGLDAECVVVGHGAAALIDAAVRAARAPAWLVPVPAFSEYRRAIEAAGACFLAAALDGSFRLDVAAYVERLDQWPGAGALLNTPHNPSGAAYGRRTLQAVLDACAARNRPLILDEAFVDYDPVQSFAMQALQYPRAVVIRSLTKFYALAGVRVGYALVPSVARASLQTVLPSWPVGSLDARIALAALADEAYERRTREQTARERESLTDALARIGLEAFASAANFLLVDLGIACGDVDGVLRELAGRGVIVRDCRSFEGLERRAFVRVAVLAPEQNERLVTALSSVLSASVRCE